MQEDSAKYIRMTTEPVPKLICVLAIPTIISMLVTALYNIADTWFVGRIGTEATAGVGLVFPIMAVIQAFGFFFGQGSGNFISRSLGARRNDQAEYMASTGCFFALIFGCLILCLGQIFRPAFLYALGARKGLVAPATIAFASDYMGIILCGAPFMCTSCVLNNQLRFQGNAFFAMIGLVTGAVLNVALDPLFIFGLGMQVKGAALATAVSQAVSCSLLYIGTLRSDNLKIHLRNFRPSFFYLKNIAIGGTPSLCRQGLSSIATLCLNAAAGASVAASMSDAANAAFSVVTKIMMFAFSALLGFGQAFQPVCGFNYGARKYDRVRRGYVFCLQTGIGFLLLASGLGFAFAPKLIALFRDDPNVIAIGAVAMRCQCCTFTLMAVVTMTNMLYQNIGRVVGATLLAVARQGLMFIPVVLILPHVFAEPIWGVYLAQPTADLFAFILAVVLAVKMYRELLQREAEVRAGGGLTDKTADRP